jgi:hypothetical protein
METAWQAILLCGLLIKNSSSEPNLRTAVSIFAQSQSPKYQKPSQ